MALRPNPDYFIAPEDAPRAPERLSRGFGGAHAGQGALPDHSEAVRLKPDDADAFINRGLARRDKATRRGPGDFKKAGRLRSAARA